MSEKEELKKLHKQRGSMKAWVTVFSKFITQFKTTSDSSPISNANLMEIEARIKTMEPCIYEFEKLQGEIEMLADDLETELEERESFNDAFFVAVSEAKTLLLSTTSECSNNSANVESADVISQPLIVNNHSIKLPTIALPTYKGEFEKWLEFRDIFESLIHTNQDINDIQKFHYLKAALHGDAAKIITALDISASNYKIAWD
jgi:Protein of unknown function (DUF1759)